MLKLDIIFCFVLPTRWVIFKILCLHFLFTYLLHLYSSSFTNSVLHSIHFSIYYLFLKALSVLVVLTLCRIHAIYVLSFVVRPF